MLIVKDDDFGFEDDVLGGKEIDFATAEFMKRPRETHSLSIKLMPADALGNLIHDDSVRTVS